MDMDSKDYGTLKDIRNVLIGLHCTLKKSKSWSSFN